MVFSSSAFLFVFLPAFLICTLVASRISVDARNAVIIAFSLAFYLFGGGAYTLILLASIVFNWAYARSVVARGRSRAAIAIGVAVNLAPLLVFKYADFLAGLTNDALFRPVFNFELPLFKLFLPVGISFYTFQSISYLIDVWRRETEPEEQLSAVAAYTLLFPQLVAGPIVRYVEIRAGLHAVRTTLDSVNLGIFFFGAGLAKKMLIADPIGRHVDQIYALATGEVTNFMAWFASVGYFLQIFFDFSGYSEMAIGLGLMIGFSFPENFRQPYRSQSITEFWRRWHMTLSRWFRDYLYIPLGGNRRSLGRTLVNLWIVFLLCGLWHGAALTFAAWGAYHGALLVAERVLKRNFHVEPKGAVGFALTTLLVIVGWVFFRSRDFDQVGAMLSKLFFLDRAGQSPFEWTYFVTPYSAVVIGVGLLFAWAPMETWNVRTRLTGARAAGAACLGVALIVVCIASLAANGFNPFIYFQF